jgi:hypothetical protein
MNIKTFVKSFIVFLFAFFSISLKAQIPQWNWVNSSSDVADEFPWASTSNDLGDVFVSGIFRESLTFNDNSIVLISGTTVQNAFVSKFNSAGEFQWSIPIGGDSSIVSILRDVGADSQGNSYIVGKIRTNGMQLVIGTSNFTIPEDNPSVNQAFIAKLDSNGEVLWLTFIEVIQELGSLSEVLGVELNNNDELFVSGSIQGSYYFGEELINTENLRHGFIAKINKDNGSFEWVNTLYANDTYQFLDILATDDGRVFASGYWSGDTLFADTHFIVNEMPLIEDNFDSFVISYSTSGEVLLLERHHSLNNDFGGILTQDADNNVSVYYPVFESLEVNGVQTEGPGFAKYSYIADASAQLDWIIPGFSYQGLVRYGDYDSEGNLFYGGDFDEATIQIGDFTLNNAGGNSGTKDMYLFSISSSGEITWATSIGGIESESLYRVRIGANDDVNICGSYISPTMNLGNFEITNEGKFTMNVFVASLSNPVGIENVQNSKHLAIYPNPTTGIVSVDLSLFPEKSVKLELIDIMGKTIQTRILLNDSVNTINIENISAGNYILRLSTITQISQTKIIVLD